MVVYLGFLGGGMKSIGSSFKTILKDTLCQEVGEKGSEK